MEKIILGFVGEIASGKGTICDYLIKNHGSGYYRFSTIIRDVMKRLHIAESRDNLQLLSNILRKDFGEDLFAKVLTEDVKADKSQIICVDGIRRPADIIYLQELPNFHLVYVTAEEQTRFERITNRTENSDDTGKTFADFQKEAQNETELLIKDVAKEAKFIIENNGTTEELYQKIESILAELN